MIAVVTCRHNRSAIHDTFVDTLRFAREKGVDLRLYVACTHDETYQDDWVTYMKYPNAPLGAKWNAALTMAINDQQNEHFLIMGDDDLISPESIQKLYETQKQGHGYVGTKSAAFFNTVDGASVYFTYQQKCDKLVGSGRMITRRAIETAGLVCQVEMIAPLWIHGMEKKPGQKYTCSFAAAEYIVKLGKGKPVMDSWRVELWQPDLMSALDNSSEFHLIDAGYLPKAIELPHPIIALKSSENIWSFSKIKRYAGSRPMKGEIVLEWLPESIKNRLIQWQNVEI